MTALLAVGASLGMPEVSNVRLAPVTAHPWGTTMVSMVSSSRASSVREVFPDTVCPPTVTPSPVTEASN